MIKRLLIGTISTLMLTGVVSIAMAANSPERCVGIWGPGNAYVTVVDLKADKALIRWTEAANAYGKKPWEIPDSVLKPFGLVTFKPGMPFSAEAVSGSGMKVDFTPRGTGYSAHFHNTTWANYDGIIFTCSPQSGQVQANK